MSDKTPSEVVNKTPGEVAYNAYCETRDWKSYNGEQLPPFAESKPEIQDGWHAAAVAVLNAEPQYILVKWTPEEARVETERVMQRCMATMLSVTVSLQKEVVAATHADLFFEGDPDAGELPITVIFATGKNAEAHRSLLGAMNEEVRVSRIGFQAPEEVAPEAPKDDAPQDPQG